MALQTKIDVTLEKFDDLWGLGDPAIVEKKFRELLPQAKALRDQSIYLQLLSQIALTQAMQKQFDAAHKTLDEAESLLTSEQPLAQARILLERGRAFQQAWHSFIRGSKAEINKVRPLFEQSFEISMKHEFDFHAINAAHMIAIIVENPEEKIAWNQRAIDMAEKTKDEKARMWFGSLYNNLGQNYLDIKQFDKALGAFKKALEYREKEGYAPNVRVAKWSIGHALRLLGQVEEALKTQNNLIHEYETISKSGNLDMTEVMFKLIRGWVYEELAEIHNAKSKSYANLAYKDLANDETFQKTSPERLERLKQIIEQ